MKATTIRCPDCRAQLKADQGVTECRYCGASVHVDAGASASEAAPEHASPPANQPAPGAATSQRQLYPSNVAAVIALALLAVSLLGYQIAKEGREAETVIQRGSMPPSPAERAAERAAKSAANPTYRWEAPHPLVRDLNGDGVDDVMGFVKGTDKTFHVAPFSGQDGQRMWMSDTIPGLESGAEPRIFLGDKVVLASGPAGDVTCFSAKDGGTLWTLRLAEVVKRAGQLDAKTILMGLKDKSFVRVDVERGTIQPMDAGDKVNADWMPMTGEVMSRLGVTLHQPVIVSDVPLPERRAFADMGWNYAALDRKGRFAVAVGQTSKGTRIPMIVRYEVKEPAEEDSRRAPEATELWRATVAGVEPLKSRLSLGFPSYMHASESYACVGYMRQDKSSGQITRFACFKMSDGTRTFDQEIPASARFNSISAAGERLYLVTSSGLTVHDAASGDVVYTVHQ